MQTRPSTGYSAGASSLATKPVTADNADDDGVFDADNLIQATDILSGAVYARYHKQKPEYYEFIRAKIGDVWEWRPRTQ